MYSGFIVFVRQNKQSEFLKKFIINSNSQKKYVFGEE